MDEVLLFTKEKKIAHNAQNFKRQILALQVASMKAWTLGSHKHW